MSHDPRQRTLGICASLCLGAGLCCLGLYALARVDEKLGSSAAIEAFREAQSRALSGTPDQSLWSAGRRAAYDKSLADRPADPVALLGIPSIGLLVPVFPGTGDLVLNRGVGWIQGTAVPGSPGNVGLAGHRDGFFRGLKDIAPGDVLELQTADGALRYVVAETSIVNPDDVEVLDPSTEPSLTLVTCYPFYFVGSAPQRFIVRGVLEDSRSFSTVNGT